MSPDSAEEALHARIADEMMRLLKVAAEHNLHLRVTGSMAVMLHSPGHASLLEEMGRRRFRDIDFWAYSKEQRQLEKLFEGDGYVGDSTIKRAQEWGVKRLLYLQPETHVKIDVFMDELVMAHTIDFKGRLDLDHPTIGLTDLLLSKLQIHAITENDLIDMIVLFAEHGLGPRDKELIDANHVVDLMKGDWGFCHTTLENLTKADQAVDRYPSLAPDVAQTARSRMRSLREEIEAARKTTRWKLRARVGTRARWYEEVDDVDR